MAQKCKFTRIKQVERGRENVPRDKASKTTTFWLDTRLSGPPGSGCRCKLFFWAPDNKNNKQNTTLGFFRQDSGAPKFCFWLFLPGFNINPSVVVGIDGRPINGVVCCCCGRRRQRPQSLVEKRNTKLFLWITNDVSLVWPAV